MTEQAVEETGIPAELEISFTYPVGDATETRKIWVKMPRPEQLLVWQRTVDALTKAPVDTSWSGTEVMGALERLRRILDSILVNKADIAWIDDSFLDGTLGFRELTPLLTLTTEAFQQAAADHLAEHGTREERRAAAKKPAKKAARKAVR